MKIETNTQSINLMNKMELMKLQAGNDIERNGFNSDNEISFNHTLKTMVSDINQQQVKADQLMAAVDSGRSDDLVGAMVMSKKAELSFSVLMQVRNKLMSGFDNIMRIPL